MAFPPQFLDELRSRVGLSAFIGRRVKLTRKGREHSGLCPFHNEKTPSFTVSDEKNFYHCFGCGAHGDVIGYVMRTENLSFPETTAVEAAVVSVIDDLGAASLKDMGRTMGHLREHFAGRMDFGKASSLLKQRLGGG